MMTLFFNWQVVQSKRFEDHFPRCQRTDNVSPYSPPDQNICLVFNSGLRAGSYHSLQNLKFASCKSPTNNSSQNFITFQLHFTATL